MNNTTEVNVQMYIDNINKLVRYIAIKEGKDFETVKEEFGV